jgi:uncharacterized protein YhbP (UPF0306 family)
MPTEDHTRTAHDIIDTNQHVVLGTADGDGRPWASPVYFAHVGYREFVWVSSPDTRHSRNIGLRPTIAMVVFDSRAAIGTGVGVYMDANAAQVTDEVGRYMQVFSARSLTHGGRAWTPDDVNERSHLRLYRAVAAEQTLLVRDGEHEARVPVDLT